MYTKIIQRNTNGGVIFKLLGGRVGTGSPGQQFGPGRVTVTGQFHKDLTRILVQCCEIFFGKVYVLL